MRKITKGEDSSGTTDRFVVVGHEPGLIGYSPMYYLSGEHCF